MKILRKISLASMIAASLLAQAGVVASDDDKSDLNAKSLDTARMKAEEELKLTFSNFQFYSFKESRIDGVYEIDTGGNMVYYSPEANVLIFGEMWDDRGTNLSEVALSKAAHARMKDFDMSVALEFGPENGHVLTEYSNPHCGYCQKLHYYLEDEKRDRGLTVRRQIIFAVEHSREAQNVAEHILCSDNPVETYHDVYNRRIPRTLLRCDEGRQRLLQHMEIAKAAGVQGTPMLVADGELIRGFHQEKIREFLEESQNTGE